MISGWTAAGVTVLLAYLYRGFKNSSGLTRVLSSQIMDRRAEEDTSEEEVFYEAETDTEGSTGDAAGDGAPGTLKERFLQLSPTQRTQTLRNCESCFCCRARKVISAVFSSESELIRSGMEGRAMSEPIVFNTIEPHRIYRLTEV